VNFVIRVVENVVKTCCWNAKKLSKVVEEIRVVERQSANYSTKSYIIHRQITNPYHNSNIVVMFPNRVFYRHLIAGVATNATRRAQLSLCKAVEHQTKNIEISTRCTSLGCETWYSRHQWGLLMWGGKLIVQVQACEAKIRNTTGTVPNTLIHADSQTSFCQWADRPTRSVSRILVIFPTRQKCKSICQFDAALIGIKNMQSLPTRSYPGVAVFCCSPIQTQSIYITFVSSQQRSCWQFCTTFVVKKVVEIHFHNFFNNF